MAPNSPRSFVSILSLAVLVIGIAALVTSSSPAASPAPFVAPRELASAGADARTPEEKASLLDRAHRAVLWASRLSDERKNALRPDEIRNQLTPLEAWQATSLLHQTIVRLQNAERKTPEMPAEIEQATVAAIALLDLAKRMEITPEEAFELVECRFTPEEMDALAKLTRTEGLATNLRQQAESFLKNELLAAERVVLTTEGDPHSASPLATMKSAGVIASVGRPALAFWLLRRFNESDPTDAECAAIVEAVGVPTLTSILNDERFAPENAKAVETILTRASRFWSAQDGIAASLKRLASRDAAERRTAETVVWRGGKQSVPFLLASLGSASDDEARAIKAALAPLGRSVRAAFVELLLHSSEPRAVERAAAFLVESGRGSELLPLWAFVYDTHRDAALRDRVAALVKKSAGELPTQEAVVTELLKRSRDYITRATPLKTDPAGKVVFWHWDTAGEASGTAGSTPPAVVSIALSVEFTYRLFAFHYANLARAVEPQNAEARQLFVVTFLQRGAYLVGLDEACEAVDAALLSMVTPPLTVGEMESAIAAALRDDQLAAAARIATILGDATTLADVLRSSESRGDNSPLVEAVRHPDPRLRFAALEAMMQLTLGSDDAEANRPYAGSSFVADALTWFARSEGNDLFLSIAPKQADATAMGEAMQSLHYQCVTATTCRDGLTNYLLTSPDIAVIAVDARCGSVSARDLLTHATAYGIPVAVYTPDERLWTADASDPRPTLTRWELRQRLPRSENPWSSPASIVFPTPTGTTAVQAMVAQLMKQTGADIVPASIRRHRARQSLAWLTEILQRQRTSGVKVYTFDTIEQVVDRATLSPYLINSGIALATEVPGLMAQQRLADLALASILPLSLREVTAAAFAEHVARFGVLLRGEQVTRLYDEYNASEHESPEVQKVLGMVLDVIERRKK